MPLSEWNRRFGRSDDLLFSENFYEFFAVNEDLITSELKSDLEIVQEVKKKEETIINDEEEQDIYEVPPPEFNDAQQAIRLLQFFL